METFLRSLRGSGEIVVTSDPPPPLDEVTAAALREHEAILRRELPPAPPPLDIEAAYWGATRLYRACQILAIREAPAELVHEALTEPYESGSGPAVDYAVDQTFQYLPSLFRLVERVAAADPLLDDLKRLGADWPLSSVGMPDVAPAPARTELAFLDHPCLRRLYVDRILETKDASRLSDETTRASVRAALGAYPELAPELAALSS